MPSAAVSPHWPAVLPHHLTVPETSLCRNLEVSALRYPDKAFCLYYGATLSYRDAWRQTLALAGFLQTDCGVRAGDRVAIYMQNSPQFVIAYYAILRANAVVVPVNPMNRREELAHVLRDSGARWVFAAQDLVEEARPALDAADGASAALVDGVVAVTYGDCIDRATDLPLPAMVSESRKTWQDRRIVAWADALARDRAPGPLTAGPDDLCVLPYTSGTTGLPKGCVHTHRSVLHTVVGGVQWFSRNQDAVYLSVLPFFHVTGMVSSMHGPVFAGATMVILSRWDREAAAVCIERHRVTVWQTISTMMIDFLAYPALGEHDLRSLTGVRGGGAAMPPAVAARLKALTGLDFVEGYGLSETIAAVMINPPERPKPQCLGIPVFDVQVRIADPATLQPLPGGEVGEILVHAPQVMKGYWNDAAASAEALVELDGKTYLRTGDLGHVDDEGYFFMVDRLKRMINAAGFKVWPAEVEAMMYEHPSVLEVCVIGAADAQRGETVKALVVLRPGAPPIDAPALVEWARGRMAAYKCPRIVEFVRALPKSASGKVRWRELQSGAVSAEAASAS